MAYNWAIALLTISVVLLLTTPQALDHTKRVFLYAAGTCLACLSLVTSVGLIYYSVLSHPGAQLAKRESNSRIEDRDDTQSISGFHGDSSESVIKNKASLLEEKKKVIVDGEKDLLHEKEVAIMEELYKECVIAMQGGLLLTSNNFGVVREAIKKAFANLDVWLSIWIRSLVDNQKLRLKRQILNTILGTLIFASVDNICKDIFLRGKMDDQGWVPVSLIATFNMVSNPCDYGYEE
ncbi:probable protein phosphatase 2C 5 [Zingiber officinale]|uniref:probable protein phosphatase 2C 5 n=1 Tax=Zingiber officinale TaxID=94328 RepID=UPI001C4C2E10|nr:probable protein phosphatase 2C 5 [Zingiber officinale]